MPTSVVAKEDNAQGVFSTKRGNNHASSEDSIETKETAATLDARTEVDGWYAKYALFILSLVYIFSTLDRSLFTVLAEDIKADLVLSDADLGFLGGTAFSLFYAVFGIVLSRLTDLWNRKKLITFSLGFWSLMTMLSGMVKSFLPFAACRFGVAVGESSAVPASYSMLYDYFSPRARTLVISIYSSAAMIGGGLGLYIGGMILDRWNMAYPDTTLAPFGLVGWQAAFIIVGLPGLLMMLWVATLREPTRGQADGLPPPPKHPQPFHETASVMVSMLPLVNITGYLQFEGGKRAAVLNLLLAVLFTLITIGLIQLTGDVAQWVAFAIGLFAAVSWLQSLAIRDPVLYNLIFKCKTLLYLYAASTVSGIGISIVGFWSILHMQRFFNISTTEVGTVTGLLTFSCGLFGALLGGVVADKLRRTHVLGKFYVILSGVCLNGIAVGFIVLANEAHIAYIGIALGFVALGMIVAPSMSTANDLMIPRGRASVTAFYYMVGFLFGGTLTPYLIGQVSDQFVIAGFDSAESLRQSMLWSSIVGIAATAVFISLAMRHIENDEKSMIKQARALGEDI